MNQPDQLPPDFDSLPRVEGMPQGCAWGVFDKDGKKDLLGTLNLVTPSVRREALAEARDGVSISLNWPLNAMPFPVPGRIAPEHRHMTLKEAGLSDGLGWDEELRINTQASSQWDSLVHWQHQPSGLAYNGIKVSKDDLSTPKDTSSNPTPTLDHWHAPGHTVARGVLIDIKHWHDTHNPSTPLDPVGGHAISVDEIEAVARHQGVEFRPGDVLVIRTGMTEFLSSSSVEPGERIRRVSGGRCAGMRGDMASVRWLWDRHFSAVAGDSWAFEALPPLREDGGDGGTEDLVLHPWLLSMFGMSIGELWDLKRLSEHCKESGRYSFLLVSVPLNIPGLVGTPANAMAIF